MDPIRVPFPTNTILRSVDMDLWSHVSSEHYSHVSSELYLIQIRVPIPTNTSHRSVDSDLSRHVTSEQFLTRIDSLMNWDALAPLTQALSARLCCEVPLRAVKMLLLARWYGLETSSLVEACQDRISFQRFLGPAIDRVCIFTGGARDDIEFQALLQNTAQAPQEALDLLHAVELQLLAKGVVVKPGLWADATAMSTSSDALGATSGVSDTVVAFHPRENAKPRDQNTTSKAPGEGTFVATVPWIAIPSSGPAPAEGDSAPVRAIIEWPWGATTELKDRLNIGRESDFCPYAHQLRPFGHVSRKHAELVACAEGVWVRDLHARNHTFVNDEKLPEGQAFLVESDSSIRCGKSFAFTLKLKSS